MQVRDIMTTRILTAKPEDAITDVARLMATKRVSGLPVVDDAGKLVGVISEGDLLPRVALGHDAPRSWWLGLLSGDHETDAFVRAHGKTVGDVMTRSVVSIAPDASLAAVARKLEASGVKRLPVVENGALVGVVSRADIVRALASIQPEAPAVHRSDAEIRKQVVSALHETRALVGIQSTVIVRDGVVELWGLASDEASINAARIAAEEIPGVKKVENHIALFPTAHYS